jgi:hypothetical protein
MVSLFDGKVADGEFHSLRAVEPRPFTTDANRLWAETLDVQVMFFMPSSQSARGFPSSTVFVVYSWYPCCQSTFVFIVLDILQSLLYTGGRWVSAVLPCGTVTDGSM